VWLCAPDEREGWAQPGREQRYDKACEVECVVVCADRVQRWGQVGGQLSGLMRSHVLPYPCRWGERGKHLGLHAKTMQVSHAPQIPASEGASKLWSHAGKFEVPF